MFLRNLIFFILCISFIISCKLKDESSGNSYKEYELKHLYSYMRGECMCKDFISIDFIKANKLERLVFTEAGSSRYYPMGTLAAHTLGFTGSDNQGLYGLEYYYDDILSGEDGYYVYAKDAGGNALDTEYSSYFPAKDGYSIVTTLDSYLQSQLESVLETVRVNHSVSNRVTGVVMDTSTGAILAMATTSPFDPNSPFVLDSVSQKKLDSSGFSSKYRQDQLYQDIIFI